MESAQKGIQALAENVAALQLAGSLSNTF